MRGDCRLDKTRRETFLHFNIDISLNSKYETNSSGLVGFKTAAGKRRTRAYLMKNLILNVLIDENTFLEIYYISVMKSLVAWAKYTWRKRFYFTPYTYFS